MDDVRYDLEPTEALRANRRQDMYALAVLIAALAMAVPFVWSAYLVLTDQVEKW